MPSMSTANVTIFDDEFLKKLEYLNIISKRLFAGQLRAERRTRKRGTGLEFADYRAYVAGVGLPQLAWEGELPLKLLVLRFVLEEGEPPASFFLCFKRSMRDLQP